MDEFTAEQRARAFVKAVAPTLTPVPLQPYLDRINAKLETESMVPEESGYTVSHKGRHKIVVRKEDGDRRQRFTVCHEIGHVVLELESEHGSGLHSYARRPPNEVCCDVFAAELLLPVALFRPEVHATDVSVSTLQRLADHFEASLLATGSRLAALSKECCAFVVSENGKIRWAVRSPRLRATSLWIPVGLNLPDGTLSRDVRDGRPSSGPTEVNAGLWFDNIDDDVLLQEDAIQLGAQDQTLTLLLLDADDLHPRRFDEPSRRKDDESGLSELDGTLRWPS